MNANPYLRNFVAQGLLAAAATLDVKAADSATDYIYVQKIIFSPTTHANGKKVTFIDSTPSTEFAAYHNVTVAAGANQSQPIVYDFGTRGYKLAIGKKLQAVSEAAGPAGSVVAYGYQSAS